MPKFLDSKINQLFLIFFGIYFLLGLINLAYLPVAWTDEIMNLDPAFQLVEHGKYVSKIWPNPGADKIFLSYPPLLQILHAAAMVTMPMDIFYMRLPLFLLHGISLIFLFITLKKLLPQMPYLTLLLMGFYALDKVVFEISRSMRIEVIEECIIAIFLYLEICQKGLYKRSALLGLLLIAHIKLWPLVGIWWLWEMFKSQKLEKKVILTSILAIAPLVFLFAIDFNVQELYGQLFFQVQKHRAPGNIFELIGNFFISRFWPVYLEQPWVILMHVFIWFCAVYHLLSKDIVLKKISLYFIGISLFWLVFLAPHYRYWPPLYFIGIVVVAGYLNAKIARVYVRKLQIFLCILLGLAASSFLARHVLALVQRQARNPKLALQWLHKEIPENRKCLIIGESLGFYYAMLHKNATYGIEFYPQHLSFDSTQSVYFLTHENTALTLRAKYVQKTIALPRWMALLGKGNTYNESLLYEIRNKKEWDLVTQKYNLP